MEFSFFALLFLGLGRPVGHLGWRRDAGCRRDAGLEGLEHHVDPFIPLLLALGRQLRLAPGDRPVDLLRRQTRRRVYELPGTRSVTSMSGLVLGPGSTTIVTRSESE